EPTLDHRRHFWVVGAARPAGDGQRPELAFTNERKQVRSGAKIDLNLPSQHVSNRLRTPFVGNVRDVDSGHLLKEFADQLRPSSLTEANIHLAWIRFRVSDKFFQRFDRDGRRYDKHPRGSSDCCD